MNHQIIIAVCLTACCLPIWGQTQVNDTTLNRMVVVEQEYNPEITDAAKINVVPAIPALSTQKKSINYDLTVSPANQLTEQTIQAYTKQEKSEKTVPGKVKLGYGSHGNAEVAASYRFQWSDKDQLNLQLGLHGENGKRNHTEKENEKWDSYFYRTQAGIDWTHLFSKLTFNVASNFGISNFNHEPEANFHKQKFTSGAFHVGISSTHPDLPVQFRAATNLLLFQRQYDLHFEKMQENIIRTEAEVKAAINEHQHIGIAMQLDNIFYQHTDFKNQSSLQLNPYFLWQKENWLMRLGAHVDPAFGFGKKFHVAPDVKVQYTINHNHLLYAQAQGGKLLNDFRRLENYSPHSLLDIQTDATYEQINATIGFRSSPIPGWWLHLYGGYQNLKNDLIQGPVWKGQDTHNTYAGAETRYAYKDLFFLTLNGIYRSWGTKHDAEEALLFKPTLEAKLNIGLRPISPLLLQVGYQHITREKVAEEKLKDVSNLYAEGDYQLFPFMHVYARINNLLNQDYLYHWGYSSMGINFLGGVSFRF